MPTNLKASIKVAIVAAFSSSLDLSTPEDQLTYSKNTALANGTSAAQADLIFHDQRSLADSATEELDLSGSLFDAFGNLLAFATIKAIFVVNTSSEQTLTIGGAAANAFAAIFGDATDTLKVPPGGALCLTAPGSGFPVTAASADLLKFANGAEGSALVYKIVLIGTST